MWSAFCGNDLPERGMSSDKMGGVRAMKSYIKDAAWELE